MLPTRSLCLLLLVFLFACERDDKLLLGDWEATLITEGMDTLAVVPSEIGFTFAPDNRYRYRSTLRYREAGTWRYDNGYLFARDTTQPAQPERIVAVEKLTVDSLVIRMRRDSAERMLTLLRTSPPPE